MTAALIVLLVLILSDWKLKCRTIRLLRQDVQRLDHSAYLSRAGARNARLHMMAVCVQEGGEYTIKEKTLVGIDAMSALIQKRDAETGDAVFGVWGERIELIPETGERS